MRPCHQATRRASLSLKSRGANRSTNKPPLPTPVAPLSGRHGILRGYTVTYVSASSWMAVSLPLEVRRTRATLRHLVAHTGYQVRVRSHTSAGAGPWSEPLLCWTSEDGE